MTIDHVGYMLLPEYKWMRIVGRIAFPIFAFMIAEGCRYTHNRVRYLLQIAVLGIAMQLVFFVTTKSLYQSVFISFTLAILLIYALDSAKSKQKLSYGVGALLVFLVITFLCFGLPDILYETDYNIDYNIVGILLPVGCYFATDRKWKIAVFALLLIALSFFYGGVQWFCLLAVPFIGAYNYKKGSLPLKNFFYLYYPIHLIVIYMIDKM